MISNHISLVKILRIQEIAVLCKKYDIPHLINNAYGITCTKIMDLLVQANKSGRVDVIISSTDKNFMVPVGGSLIYSSNDVSSIHYILSNL